jgi:hypothetical protein
MIKFLHYIFGTLNNFKGLFRDRLDAIKYIVISSKLQFDCDNKDVIIINDFCGYSDVREKNFQGNSYLCDRSAIVNVLQSFSGVKIVVLTSTTPGGAESRGLARTYLPVADVVLCTNNIGQDIGAYAAGINFCDQLSCSFGTLTLLNTSQFLPSDKITEFVNADFDSDLLLGVSYGVGPRFWPIKRTHIQSFAIKAAYSALSDIFNSVAPNLMFYSSKYRVIMNGEVAISSHAINRKMKLALFEGGSIRRINYSRSIFHYDYRRIIFSRLNR